MEDRRIGASSAPDAVGLDRRSFLEYFSAAGLGGTLLPGVLWAQVQEAPTLTLEILREAEKVAGLEFTDDERQMMLQGLQRDLQSYEALRQEPIPNEVPPAVRFDPMLPGREYPTQTRPMRMTRERGVERPADLEEAAFWPVTRLSELVRTRQVSSVELTEMYLSRLETHGPRLEAVDGDGRPEARRGGRRAGGQADPRSPCHG